jgi:hypothetical protein
MIASDGITSRTTAAFCGAGRSAALTCLREQRAFISPLVRRIVKAPDRGDQCRSSTKEEGVADLAQFSTWSARSTSVRNFTASLASDPLGQGEGALQELCEVVILRVQAIASFSQRRSRVVERTRCQIQLALQRLEETLGRYSRVVTGSASRTGKSSRRGDWLSPRACIASEEDGDVRLRPDKASRVGSTLLYGLQEFSMTFDVAPGVPPLSAW